MVLLVFRNNTCLNLVLVYWRYYATCGSCCLLHVKLSILLACLIWIMWARSIVLVTVLIVHYVVLLKLSGKNCNCRPLLLMLTIWSTNYFILKIIWCSCVVLLRLPKNFIFLNVTFILILFCLNLICTWFQIVWISRLIFLIIEIFRGRRSIVNYLSIRAHSSMYFIWSPNLESLGFVLIHLLA